MIFDIDPIGKQTRRRRSRLARTLLGATALLGAASAHAETLMDAVNAAYAGNPDLVGQRYRQKSTNEAYVQTRAQYGPQLSLQGVATYNHTKRPIFGTSETRTGEAALSLSQPVYTGGRLRGQLAEARANVHSSEETLRRVEGEVVQSVIIAYSAVLRDQQRLEVSRQNVEVLRAQLTERRAKRKVGDVTVTDVAQSDSRLASGESSLATAAAQLEISVGDYLRIVGHAPGDLAPLPDLPGLPASIDEAFDVAIAENANIGAARYSEEASMASVAAERGNSRPTASISAQAGKTGSLSPFDRHELTTQVVAQVTITQPLFQSGTINSRIRQAKDLNSVAQAALDGERRQALQDVVVAWNQVTAARVAVTAGTRQVEAAQIAFAGMEREERYGLRSTIEVLNAEQELASAQLGLLSSRHNEFIARAALLLAMGRLDARTVNSALPARDPEAEFKKVRNYGMTPLEPAAMLLDHVGSASPYAKRKPDLRGQGQPKPPGGEALPPTPDRIYTSAPLVPITKSPLVPADSLPSIVEDYESPRSNEKTPQ